MNVTIKRIGISSAFRVGFTLNIIVFAIFGLIGGLLQIFLAGALSSGYRIYGGSSVNLVSAGLPILCIGYVIGTFAVGILGGIGFAIYALIYNLASGMIGGLQVQLSRDNS